MKFSKIVFSFIIFFIWITNLNAQQWEHKSNWEWAAKARCYSQVAPLDMLTDKTGKQWITGFYVGDALFDSTTLHNNSIDGYYDIFLATIENGNWISLKSYGNESAEEGRALCMDGNGNIYLLAVFFSDSILVEGQWLHNHSNSGEILLMKYKPDGSFVWVKHFGGIGWDQVYTMKIDDTDHIWIGGDFTGGSLPLGNDTLPHDNSFTDIDAFIARLDTNGNVNWARSFHSGNNESLWKLAPLPGGKMAASFVSDGSQLTISPYFLSDDYSESFLAAFDSSGQTLWAKAVQCYGISDIASNKNGDLFYASYFFADSINVDGQTVHARLDINWSGSYLMASFDSSGTLNWARANYADYYLDYTHLLTDDSGYVYLYGIPGGSLGHNIAIGDSLFHHDGVFFFAKTDPANGELIWRTQNDNQAYSTETITACADADNNFTVAGAIYLPGNTQFGNYDLTYTNTGDLFMMFVAQFGDTLIYIPHDPPVDTTGMIQPYIFSPNPFHDNFSIFNADSNIWLCKIYSVDGRLINSFIIDRGLNTFSVPELAAGLYIAELHTQGNKKVMKRKLIKQ